MLKIDYLNQYFDEDWLRENYLPTRFRCQNIGPQSYSATASGFFGNLENVFEVAQMLLDDPVLIDLRNDDASADDS